MGGPFGIYCLCTAVLLLAKRRCEHINTHTHIHKHPVCLGTYATNFGPITVDCSAWFFFDHSTHTLTHAHKVKLWKFVAFVAKHNILSKSVRRTVNRSQHANQNKVDKDRATNDWYMWFLERTTLTNPDKILKIKEEKKTQNDNNTSKT